MNQPAETTPLLNLGLTSYEAGAYVALTRRERATGAEVARIAGLPRQRIYDVLNGLVDRGLAVLVIWGTGHGLGPLGTRLPADNAFSVQLFLLFVGPTLLCLAAALE